MPASTGGQGGEERGRSPRSAAAEPRGREGWGLGWDLAPSGLTAQLTKTSKRLLLEAAGRLCKRDCRLSLGWVLWSASTWNTGSTVRQV